MTAAEANDDGQLQRPQRGSAPRRWGIQFPALLTLVCLGAGSRAVRADSPAGEVSTTAGLDGLHLLLGPVGSGLHVDDGWDGAFGAFAGLAWVREASALSVVGGNAGYVRQAVVDRGRAWFEAVAATNRIIGVPLGLSAGFALEIDDVRPARPGWQVTVWGFAGIAPYVRAGWIDRSGRFAEIGLAIVLPTLSW